MKKATSTNSLNEQFLYQTCELNSALTMISGRWKGQIVYSIHLGKNRFSLLKKELPRISDQVLGKQVGELEQHGIIVKRTLSNCTPPSVEYDLTPKGAGIVPVLEGLCEWAKKYSQLKVVH